ncbi:unnamed protein product, partial [Didymodactylos carnosus]
NDMPLTVTRTDVDSTYSVRFKLFYKHDNKLFEHPFTLCSDINTTTDDQNEVWFNIDKSENLSVQLFIIIKRLRNFNRDDTERYYVAIDQNIGLSPHFPDFHDIYLQMSCFCNGKKDDDVWCNSEKPILLPRLILDGWNFENTYLRFRYPTELRNCTFPCEIKLRHDENNLSWGTTDGQYVVDFAFDQLPISNTPVQKYSNIKLSSDIISLFDNIDRQQSITAERDQHCYHLLKFVIPILPEHDGKRVYLRMRHSTTKDYNPSVPALIEDIVTYRCSIHTISPLNIQPITSFSQQLQCNSSVTEQSNEATQSRAKILKRRQSGIWLTEAKSTNSSPCASD